MRSEVKLEKDFNSIVFILGSTNLLPQFVGKDSLKISPFIFMDGNDNVWIDLLTEPNQILPRSMSRGMRTFFNGAPSFPKLLYETECGRIESRIPFAIINVAMKHGIDQARLFWLTELKYLVKISLELGRVSNKHHEAVLLHHKFHLPVLRIIAVYLLAAKVIEPPPFFRMFRYDLQKFFLIRINEKRPFCAFLVCTVDGL